MDSISHQVRSYIGLGQCSFNLFRCRSPTVKIFLTNYFGQTAGPFRVPTSPMRVGNKISLNPLLQFITAKYMHSESVGNWRFGNWSIFMTIGPFSRPAFHITRPVEFFGRVVSWSIIVNIIMIPLLSSMKKIMCSIKLLLLLVLF